VSSAAAPVAYASGLPRAWLLALLGALLAVAVAVEVARARSARARHHFTRYTGALLRAHEHDRWSGATWMLGAYVTAVIVYPRPFAVAAMWAVGVGDASAAVVGRWWSERRRLAAGEREARPGKTYAGTLACFAAALAGARFVAGLPLAAALLAALLAALAERPRAPFDDNLRIVLGVGVAALVWQLAHAVA
jgi:dolichol kinase